MGRRVNDLGLWFGIAIGDLDAIEIGRRDQGGTDLGLGHSRG